MFRAPGSRRFVVGGLHGFVDDASVEEVDAAIGVPRVAWVVGDHADRRAGLVELAEELHDRFAALRIEVAGRLVGEQDDRLAGDRARHGDALLLTAGQLARQVFRAVRHAHALEGVGHTLAAFGRPHPAVGERQLDVLEHRQVANQVEALEDESDLAIADPRPLRGPQLGDRTVVQVIRAVRGGVEQAENREERRLAASRRPADRDVFAPGDLQAHLRERVRLHFLGGEDLGEILKLDDRRQSTRVHTLSAPTEDGRDRTRPTSTCRTTRPRRRRSIPRRFRPRSPRCDRASPARDWRCRRVAP